MNDTSLAAPYLRATKDPCAYLVVKQGDNLVVADSKGQRKSKYLSPQQFKIARRNALTALEADPNNSLSPKLQALIRYNDDDI